MSNIVFSYRNQLSSEQFNRRFADILGGSILAGYIFELGTQPGKISLVRGADPSNLLVTKNGVRIEEPADLIDIITIEDNIGAADRMDSVYAHYVYGTSDAQVTYLVVKGDDQGQPAMLESPDTHTLLGYIQVPANGGSLTPQSLLPREVGLAFLTVAGEALFQKGFTSKGAVAFNDKADFSGPASFKGKARVELEPTEANDATNKQYVDGATRKVAPFDILSSGYQDQSRVFTVVEQKRTDGTLLLKSTLSNPDANNNYRTLTIDHYDEAGANVIDQQVWTLSYDANFNIVSKTIT